VWEVDDDEARLLLATLNRLEGRDDPSARARLVAHLAEGRSPEDLARLLPEPADAVERLLVLAKPPPAALDPAAIEPPARPMTFFLSAEQYALVADALREVAAAVTSGDRKVAAATEHVNPAPPGHSPASPWRRPADGHGGPPPAAREGAMPRAEQLERLAAWYLESKGRQ
jgi:hypothetical protein